MASIDFKRAVITIEDGTTPTANSITVKLGDGNFTYDETRNLVQDKDRGKIGTVREGDEEPVNWSLTSRWEEITASTGDPPTVEDAMKQRGEAAAWTTTSEDPCEPYSFNLIFTYTPLCEDAQLEVITLPLSRHTSIKHDPKTAMLDITGFANVKEATVERIDQ